MVVRDGKVDAARGLGGLELGRRSPSQPTGAARGNADRRSQNREEAEMDHAKGKYEKAVPARLSVE